MKIEEIDLYNLLINQNYSKYGIAEDVIISSDPEDGGADHCCIIQEVESLKFYRLYYSDWDIQYNFEINENTNEITRCDIDCELEEVFPIQKTITVYE